MILRGSVQNKGGVELGRVRSTIFKSVSFTFKNEEYTGVAGLRGSL